MAHAVRCFQAISARRRAYQCLRPSTPKHRLPASVSEAAKRFATEASLWYLAVHSRLLPLQYGCQTVRLSNFRECTGKRVGSLLIIEIFL